jgi:hypothetical protein
MRFFRGPYGDPVRVILLIERHPLVAIAIASLACIVIDAALRVPRSLVCRTATMQARAWRASMAPTFTKPLSTSQIKAWTTAVASAWPDFIQPPVFEQNYFDDRTARIRLWRSYTAGNMIIPPTDLVIRVEFRRTGTDGRWYTRDITAIGWQRDFGLSPLQRRVFPVLPWLRLAPFAWLFVLAFRFNIRRRRHVRGLCPNCSYYRGASLVCPECGCPCDHS